MVFTEPQVGGAAASCEWEGQEVCEGAVTRDREGSRLLQAQTLNSNQLDSFIFKLLTQLLHSNTLISIQICVEGKLKFKPRDQVPKGFPVGGRGEPPVTCH